MARECQRQRPPAAVLAGIAAAAAGALVAGSTSVSAFTVPLPMLPGTNRHAHPGKTPFTATSTASAARLGRLAPEVAVAVVAAAGAALAASRQRKRSTIAALAQSAAPANHHWRFIAMKGNRLTLRAWPWEDDDPYSRCSAVKVQIGLQFSKPLLDSLNNLADTADTSTDEGLHQLLLDVMLALRRAQGSWRYGHVERLLFGSEDDGREAGAALQRWGIEGQSKWGDGEAWEKMGGAAPTGTTEYIVVTVLMSCYGTLCAGDQELKVRSMTDLKKVLDSMSGVQADELIQLDVQWIPEEPGDSLSAMELTAKFPEMAIL